jgi:hypothetical protein
MRCQYFYVALLAASLWTVSLLAVGPTGSIIGTVIDPSGAVVPKAHVAVRNQETGAKRTVQTNDDGDYSVPLLPPGVYEVTAEMVGFRRSVYSNVRLDVDQAARADFVLQLGRPTDVVVVTGAPPLVQTDTSTLGQVINRRQVSELPLNERNFLTFALLVPGANPGVEGAMNTTQGGAISVNGAREQSNNFMLDGVDNNDLYINQYSVLPSVDAIEEFKVQSGNYAAEYGRSMGAQINIVLKSGTNMFHGSVFEFMRNRTLDAKNFFDLPDCTSNSVPGTCGPIPRFDRNQFGGTLGGPIQKDKTFFFVSYEGLRLRQATTRQAAVPSQEQRITAEAMAEGMGGGLNPAGEAMFNLLPAANTGADLLNSNVYTASPTNRNAENLLTIKLDRQAGANNKFSGHYSLFNEKRFNVFDPVNSFTALPGYGSFTINRGQNVGLDWTRVFNPRWVNEFRLGFNRLRAAALQESYGTNVSQQLGFPTVLTRPVDLGFPDVSILGFDGIGEPVNYPQDRHDNTFHFVDNLAWSRGLNQFKAGADVRRFQLNDYLDFIARGQWSFQGGTTGDPLVALSQLLLGMPDYVVAVHGDTDNGLRTTAYNFYLQDDIRVKPRLTLNAGIRYEYNTPPIEVQNRFSVPDLAANLQNCTSYPDCLFLQAGTDGIPRGTYSPTRTNFAPRLGLAWRPLKTERFVVRTAYSIFYDVGIMNANIFPRFNPPFFGISYFPNNPYSPLVIQNILDQPGVPEVQANMISPHYREGYMQQRNLDLQYEVKPNWMVDLAYVGTKGTHLPSPRDLNQPDLLTGVAPYPQLSSILFMDSVASSTYNALQFRSEKRVSKGLAFLAAYTFSKSIDDSSAVFAGSVGSGLPQDSNNLRAERGLSDFDMRHRLSVSYLYDLPFGAGERWLNREGLLYHLLGNWQTSGILTLQSGSPFTANMATARNPAAITSLGVSDRPDLIANPFKAGPVAANSNPACHTTISQGGLAADQVRAPQSWFNPCAFDAPPSDRYGTEGRNQLTGPGTNNLDFAVFKNFHVRKEKNLLQLRAEIFNSFNHPLFDIPIAGRVFDTSTFGIISSANFYGNRPPRQLQLGFRYLF